jgi:tetratricopeptide (TPR) repeat protein
MKTIKMMLCIGVIVCNIPHTIAQTDKIAAAFSTSYDKETKKDYTSAVSAIQEVYDAKSYEINLRLGWLQYEAAQYKESMASYKLAMDLMPYSIEAKLGYAYPAAALGNMDVVIAEYNEILTIDPQNSTANYRMGYIYYYKKDYANAFKYFEKVVNLYPFNYDGLLMYAWTNYQMGKTREAKVLFEKVLWLSPNDKSATEGLGLIK